VCVVITEVFVGEDGYILIIWISFYLIVRLAREGICSVGCPWFIFELNIILGNFRDVSYHAWSDFSWFPVISQVCVVRIHQNRYFSSFEQVRLAS
jgi:hypothetical protein